MTETEIEQAFWAWRNAVKVRDYLALAAWKAAWEQSREVNYEIGFQAGKEEGVYQERDRHEQPDLDVDR